jgi:hypothetical protein
LISPAPWAMQKSKHACALAWSEKSEQFRLSPEHEQSAEGAPDCALVGRAKTTVFVGIGVADAIPVGGLVSVGR